MAPERRNQVVFDWLDGVLRFNGNPSRERNLPLQPRLLLALEHAERYRISR